MSILAVSLFGLSLLLSFSSSTKSNLFLLLVMALNPIANQIGIFSSPKFALAGLVFIHLIFPWLIFRKLHLILLDHIGIWFGIFLVYSMAVLIIQASRYPISTFSGIKTLLLFLGTYLWTRGLAIKIESDFGGLLNRQFIKLLRMTTIVVTILGQMLSEEYVVDGRLRLGGGFDAAAVLGLLLIFTSLHSEDLKTITTFLDLVLGMSLIFLSGSRSGLIALIVGIFWFTFTTFYKHSRAKKYLLSLGTIAIGGLIIGVGAISLNARSLDFLRLFGSDESNQIGTFGFRQQMTSHMINAFLESDLLTRVIGFGPGSGTWLAGQWLNVLLGDASTYTSGRVFHNGLVQILVEQGIIGFILICIVSLFCIFQNRIRSNGDFRLGWFVIFCIVLLFSSNPFSSSANLTTLAFVPFFCRISSRVNDGKGKII